MCVLFIYSLICVLKRSQMILVVAICETCPPSEADVITPVLLNLFDSRASLLALLKLLIEREVKTTSSYFILPRDKNQSKISS